MPMIDIVIPLGTGSEWENNELRYSLRSIEKHLKNYRNIYIIGDLPDWTKNVIRIPFEETGHPSQNIMNKVLAACDNDSISDNFMFWNDDFFLLKDIDAIKYPFYYRGELKSSIPRMQGNWYLDYILETIQELKQRDFTTGNFDIHCPIIYNRHKFKIAVAAYDFSKKLIVKSIYCNTLGIPGEYMEDCKIIGRTASWRLQQKIKDRHIFSIGDRCLIPYPPEEESSVKVLLRELYPNKSKYEL